MRPLIHRLLLDNLEVAAGHNCCPSATLPIPESSRLVGV